MFNLLVIALIALYAASSCSGSKFADKAETKKVDENKSTDKLVSEQVQEPEDVTGAYLTCQLTNELASEYSCGVMDSNFKKIPNKLISIKTVSARSCLQQDSTDKSLTFKLIGDELNQPWNFSTVVKSGEVSLPFKLTANVNSKDLMTSLPTKDSCSVAPADPEVLVNQVDPLESAALKEFTGGGNSNYSKAEIRFKISGVLGFEVAVIRSRNKSDLEVCSGVKVGSFQGTAEEVARTLEDADPAIDSLITYLYKICIFDSEKKPHDVFKDILEIRMDARANSISVAAQSCAEFCQAKGEHCVSVGTDADGTNGQVQYRDSWWEQIIEGKCHKGDGYLTVAADCNTTFRGVEHNCIDLARLTCKCQI